jgi:hypothetical protein
MGVEIDGLTEEYSSSSTVGSSFVVLTLIAPRMSDHWFSAAVCTVVHFQSGTSSSAFAQAWAALIIDTPNRASTEFDAFEKESSAPASMPSVLPVYGKLIVALVFAGVIVMFDGAATVERKVPAVVIACLETPVGA